MFIDGIKALLRKESRFEFVAEANDGAEALSLLESTEVDVLISDISMPEVSGVDLIKQVKTKWPEIKILVISMHNEKEIVAEIMLAEAEGYLLKNASKEELVKAITEVASGSYHYSKEVMNTMLQKLKKSAKKEKAIDLISDREMEVLKLIIQEYSTQQIADALFISPRTVDTHRKHIMAKTESSSIIGLMKFAFRNDLVV